MTRGRAVEEEGEEEGGTTGDGAGGGAGEMLSTSEAPATRTTERGVRPEATTGGTMPGRVRE